MGVLHAENSNTAFDPIKAEAKFYLHSANDTIGFKMGTDEGEIAVDFLDSIDYTELPSKDDIILFSGQDTIIIKYDTVPIKVIITSPNDTVIEIIKFIKDRIELLKEYSTFANIPSIEYGRFYYSSPSDPNLTKLRETYNLDSVAGGGSEIDRIIRLMNWVHEMVPHEDSKKAYNPKPSNALNIIEVCKSEKRGANCRMLATILNEVYLSMGFKSRHATCLPYNKEDPDCHVVNMVYSDSLGKWLYMDPTQGAYFMDDSGNILSISEVRDYLIENKSLQINNDANYHGVPTDFGWYKNYMAKNLFRFLCPLGSKFGYESRAGERIWITLNPTGYDAAKNMKADTTSDSTAQYIDYYTDNAGYFWMKPE
jgi:hypothetical protein